MGIFGVTTGKDYIYFGTRSDICALCALEKAKSDRIGIAAAQTALKGMLEGQKVVRFAVNSTNITLCLDHIHKLSNNNKEAITEDSESVQHEE